MSRKKKSRWAHDKVRQSRQRTELMILLLKAGLYPFRQAVIAAGIPVEESQLAYMACIRKSTRGKAGEYRRRILEAAHRRMLEEAQAGLRKVETE